MGSAQQSDGIGVLSQVGKLLQKIHQGYSKIVTPLIDILKKDTTWDWDTKCQMAFEGLK